MERSQLEETLALLQAQCAVQNLVLKTLIHRDRDPLALLGAWREIRTDAATARSLLPADARHSRWLAEQIESFTEAWTAELADLAIDATPQQALQQPVVDEQPAMPKRRPPPRRRKSPG
jgi:hypothetical protein